MALPSFPAVLTLSLIGTLAGLLAVAAIGDIRHFTISNRLCLAVAILGLVFTLADVNLPGEQLLQGPVKWHLIATLAITLIIFAVCTIFFALKLMGGGDVKLITAVSLWTGPRWTLDFLLVTAIAGGLVTLGILLLSLMKGRIAGDVSQIVKTSGTIMPEMAVPYGVGIAIGGLFAAYRMGFDILMSH